MGGLCNLLFELSSDDRMKITTMFGNEKLKLYHVAASK
jgi:hypothetical protein